ncbi:metallophosphoesterase [Leucobacter sp. OAMLP11]|uniref:metallophosphoesterase n=1 Tax=unclassified Leucobacter TaxID=2621730 RepID=UPI000C1978AE|nr:MULTISPECIES: metallophosphoesterase [unclassified Leucobacter]PII84813.1 phosphohydrolase [Leucobacter sp. OLCALW19]PIO50756.1 metallophosphoesterase [Leucobacter sp. OAMLP11]
MAGRKNARAAVALGAAAAGVAVWATLVERRLFTVRRHTLPLLPRGSAPVRILQLSDLHLAPWQESKIDWVRSLSELNPDLLVLTGDLMGHIDARPSLVHALQPLAARARAGVFVHGSNDYYGPKLKNPLKYLSAPSRLSTRAQDIDNAALTRSLTDDLGLTDLNNSAEWLELAGTRFELLGLNDPHIRYDDAERMRAARTAESTEARASKRAPQAGSPVRLGVVHAPYQGALGALLDEGSELILAGHTHGGQVRIPGVGALTANCDLPVRQARGLSVWYDAERAAYLNVSAGLGNSIYAPVRFCCKPEVTLLTLEAAR